MVVDPRYSLTYRYALGLVVLAALVVIPVRMPKWDPYVLTSGVTIYNDRYADIPTDSLRREDMRRDEMLYYREGLTATISVHRIGKDYVYFKTNGKVDGSHGDALTQLMSGYLGIFFNPRAERAAVIGLGTGMTTRAISAFPLREIEVMEIEPAMIQAAGFFGDKNGKILENPRVRVIHTDGRNYILATRKRYDVISSEPSNPWIAGIANLYTREFYEVIKSKLTDDGVFAQWIHNYSMSPDDFRMAFRTFGEAFPHVTVWVMKESDFLLVGSKKEQVFDYKLLSEFFAKSEAMQADFQELGLSDIYAALGFYRMGKKELMAFTQGAAINTDDGAQLEYSAPKSVRRATSGLNRKLMEPFIVTAPWLNSKPIPVPEPLRHFYLAQAYQGSDWHSGALKEVDEAIRLDPSNPNFYVLKTKILLDQEKSADAATAALTALKLSPKTIHPILILSDDFYLREAKAIYTKTIEMGTREVLPYLGLGNIALHYNDLNEAEKWFAQAKNTNADHPAVLLAWGRLLLARENWQQAVEYLERSKEKGEDSATLFGALGDSYFQLKVWDKAVEAYHQAFRSRNKKVEWRLSMGIALAQMGKVDAAEEKFREVLALAPDNDQAWQELQKLGKRY
jgi:spermidine synthase